MNPKRKMIKKKPGEPGFEVFKYPKYVMTYKFKKEKKKDDSRYGAYNSGERSNSSGGGNGSITSVVGMLFNNNSKP